MWFVAGDIAQMIEFEIHIISNSCVNSALTA